MQARYCCVECAVADWDRHREYCVVVQEKIKDNTRKEVDDPMLKGDSEFFFAEKAKDPGE